MLLIAFAFVLPHTAFAAEKAELLDDSKEVNWVDIQKWGTKPADGFFVYPTLAMDFAPRLAD